MIQKYVNDMNFRETKEDVDKIYQFTEGEDMSIKATVGPYFDPAILSEISESKQSSSLQGKSIAIVFWDISKFSSLTENLKDAPHLLLGFLQEYFSESIRIVHEHDGIIDKFLGDGIMAYFGKNDNDKGLKGSINAINSALKLRASFVKIKSKWIELWKTRTKQIADINLKCGINTGEILMGEIVAQGMKQFTVFGSTVNLASRLESEADKDQIIVSHYTKILLGNLFESKKIELGEKRIKAFKHISEYYEIITDHAIPISDY